MDNFTYLVLELAWALPPIFLQWLVGWRYLRRHRIAWALAVLLPTLYLSLADSTALGVVWTIRQDKSLGVLLGNVPVEEIVFFLVTNMLVAQSILLAAHGRELSAEWGERFSGVGARLSHWRKRVERGREEAGA